MDQTLFALPIISGKTDVARAFLRALEGERKGQYAASEERLGLTKEVGAVQAGPRGIWMSSTSQGRTLGWPSRGSRCRTMHSTNGSRSG